MDPCCLSCALRGSPIQSSVMQGLMAVPVADIVKMDDEDVKQTCFPLNPAQMVMLTHAAKRTLLFLGETSKVLHPRYYQQTDLKLDVLPEFKIKKGSVLQVLNDSWPPGGVYDLLSNLLMQANKTVKDECKYPNLIGVAPYRALRIINGEVEIYEPDRGMQIIRIDMNGLTMEDRMLELERRIILIDNVSLIIAYCDDGIRDGDAPDFQMWVDLFNRIYGDLEDMWIVLVTRTVRHFSISGGMTTGEILRSLNRNANHSTLRNTYCVNVVGTRVHIMDASTALMDA